MNPPYKLVEKAITEVHAKFLYEYFNIRNEATKYLLKNKLVERHPIHGDFDESDWLSPKSPYVIYGDPMFDLEMMEQLETVKSESGEDLMPMVSYARLYTKDDELIRHTDRIWNRKITATVHLGSEGSNNSWPLYVQSLEGETAEVHLNAGDMLVYVGECQHWREPCEHDNYSQLMLHYTQKGSVTPENEPNEFVVTLVGDVVCDSPAYFMFILEFPLNSVPANVTVAPALPVVGVTVKVGFVK